MSVKPEILVRNIILTVMFCLISLFAIGKIIGNEKFTLIGQIGFLFLFSVLAFGLFAFGSFLVIRKLFFNTKNR
jgi:accessory gene regulator protein AgrB